MREIIVLDLTQADLGYLNIRVVFWFQIPVGRQVQKPAFQSAVDPIIAGGNSPTSSEISLLQSGALLEQVSSYRFPKTFTAAQLKADLLAAYQTAATYISGLPNPMNYYGVSFDDVSGWSA